MRLDRAENAGDEHLASVPPSIVSGTLRAMSRAPGAPVTASNRARVLRAAGLLAALGSLAFEGQFRGCGVDSSPPSTTLPEGEPPECLLDTDCTASMCNLATCIAGTCREAPSLIDDDRDGAIARPCGDDCDDGNPSVAPFVGETCDTVDNDCDLRIDEGASATPRAYEIGADVRAAEAVDDLPGVVLFTLDVAPMGRDLVARWFDLAPSAPFASETLAATLDEDALVATLPTPGGARVVWTSPTERVVREATIAVTRTDTSAAITVSPTTDLATDVAVTALRVTQTASGVALLLEVLDETSGTVTRSLLVPGTPAAPLAYTEGAFDLASRATRLYTLAADAEIAVLDASGTEVQRVIIPDAFAVSGLTSWNGRLLATTFDGSSDWLTEITAVDMVGDRFPVSSGFGTDLQTHPLESSLAITRISSGVDLTIYDSTLLATESYAGLVYSSTGLYGHRSVHETGAGLALVVSRGRPSEGSSVVVLQCR